MKVLLRVAAPVLACTLVGCATDPYSVAPQPPIAIKQAECEHTRRIVGQPCRVIQGRAEIRRLLGAGRR